MRGSLSTRKYSWLKTPLKEILLSTRIPRLNQMNSLIKRKISLLSYSANMVWRK